MQELTTHSTRGLHKTSEKLREFRTEERASRGAPPSPSAGGHPPIRSLLLSATDLVIRFRKENVSVMTVHEFVKRAADGATETSFGKTILHMLAYPLEKCLAKNLQFFSANDSRLSAEPLQLRWCQTIRDRRVNLIGFLVPKWVCLVAVSHLVNCLFSLTALGGGQVDRASAYAKPDKAIRNATSTALSSAEVQIQWSV